MLLLLINRSEQRDLQADLSEQQEVRDILAEFNSPSRLCPVANGHRNKCRYNVRQTEHHERENSTSAPCNLKVPRSNPVISNDCLH